MRQRFCLTRCYGVGIFAVGEIDISIEAGNQFFIAYAVFRREQTGCGDDGNMAVGHGKMLILLRLRFLVALD